MSAKPPRGLFITGTDTGIGKTFVAAVIARQMVAAGIRVGVYKPVLSGYNLDLSTATSTTLVDCRDDDVLLWHAANSPGDVVRVCPQRFRTPLAPHLAARAEGREVDTELLRSGVEYWRQRSDFVVIEGAGGLFSPLSDRDLVADLVCDFGYPLLIVAPNRLGVINQVLQSVIAAAHYRHGLAVACVVLNELPDPSNTIDLSRESNHRELQQRCNVPVISLKAGETGRAVEWVELAQRMQVHR